MNKTSYNYGHARQTLPYGKYNEDGTTYIFNRDYQIIWKYNLVAEKVAFEEAKIVGKQCDWLYKDGSAPWESNATLKRCKKINAALMQDELAWK